jgi:hypothetical protein
MIVHVRFAPKADKLQKLRLVRFVPKAAVSNRSEAALLVHFVGAGEHLGTWPVYTPI